MGNTCGTKSEQEGQIDFKSNRNILNTHISHCIRAFEVKTSRYGR